MNAFRMELRRKSKSALPRGILDTDFPLFEIEEEDDAVLSPTVPKV